MEILAKPSTISQQAGHGETRAPELSALGSLVSDSIQRIALRSDVESLRGELVAAGAELDRARADRSAALAQLRALEREQLEHRSLAERNARQSESASRAQARAVQRINAQEKEIHELRDLCVALRDRQRQEALVTARIREENESLRSRAEALEAKAKDAAAATTASGQALLAAHAEARAQHAEIATLRAEVARAAADRRTWTDSQDRRSEEIEHQQKRLRAYSRMLNDAKQSLATDCAKFADEVRAALTLHPLRDLLAYTAFELTKTETALRTVPTSSAEREPLGEAVRRLVEQRDFLSSVIEASRKELERRAGAIESMADAISLAAALPPPPPVAALSGKEKS